MRPRCVIPGCQGCDYCRAEALLAERVEQRQAQFAPMFAEVLRMAVAMEADEAMRLVAEGSLPRRLRWLARHPRMLRVLWRLRPAWRPRVFVGADLGVTVMSALTADGTLVVLTTEQATWLRRAR